LPNLNGQSISDIFFLDSLTGWAVTGTNSGPGHINYITKTTNSGDNWNIVFSDTSFFSKVKFVNSNSGFACGGSGGGTAFFYKSTNGGDNWNRIVNTGANAFEDISVLNKDTLWVVDHDGLVGGVFRTTNGGLNWTQQYSAGSQNPNVIYMYNSRIGFIAKNSFPQFNTLRRTTNGGLNWSNINAEGFTQMYFFDSLIGWKCTGLPDSSMKKTINGGLTWIKENLPQGGYISDLGGMLKFSNINKDTIWGIGNYLLYPNNGVHPFLYRTTNGGTNWYYQIPDTSIINNVQSYYFINFVNKYNGWAYNDAKGIHTITGGDTTFLSSIHQISNETPKDYKLFQNYPNPFNPRTVIGYELKKAGDIKIKIYSITGSEVFTLVNQRQSAGVYEVDMPGIGLSSGVYFYSLIVDDKRIDSKSMVLIK